ncbi:MAG: hypothetical protein ACYCZ6_17925 [Polaromonas sp.]
MKVFHLIAVFPAGVDTNGMNQIRLHDFTVLADSLQHAWQEIADMHTPVNPDGPRAYAEEMHIVCEAHEAWGIEIKPSENSVIQQPSTRRNQFATLAQHEGWKRVTPYQHLHELPESLRNHFDKAFDKRFAERHPTYSSQAQEACRGS